MGTIQVSPGQSGQLVVRFPYSSERVAAIKAVPGRRWHPEEKYWTVPHTPESLKHVRSLFTSDRVVVAAAVEATSPELPAAHMQEIVTALDTELTLRGYSLRTRNTYRLHVLRFLKWLRHDPAKAQKGDLVAYLLDILDTGLSASYVRQARAALLIVYKSVLRQPEKVANLPCAKDKKLLPTVMSRGDVRRLLKATANVREEALLTVIYSAGLRASEAISLRVEDIHSERKQIRVRGGKGDKDRYTVLADRALSVLRSYYRSYRPGEWLFPGRKPGTHMSTGRARRILARPKEGRDRNRRNPAHIAPLLRDALAGRRRRPPPHSGVAGSQQHSDDSTVHTGEQTTAERGQESAGSSPASTEGRG